MKLRFITMMLLIPMLFCCKKADNTQDEDKGNNQEQVNTDPFADVLPPEVTNGEVILTTNANVEKFVTNVTYPENNYTSTHILDADYQPTAPGKDDIPSKYTIRWEADPSVKLEDTKVLLQEDITGGWSHEFAFPDVAEEEVKGQKVRYLIIYNMVPNLKYDFEVKAGDKIIKSGSFRTEGHCRQVYFSAVHNSRDLGGWKTKDGKKKVKYRKIYRGGRLNEGLLSRGKRDLVAEGIKAQLDLRGKDDVLTEDNCTLKNVGVEGWSFCAPVIEEGYDLLLRDDAERAKQCMQFIMKCVKEDKPVYFHCSLGRDRTGTVAMMVLGLLGVDEGEISKEYEITQFAPHGYSVCTGETTKMTRKTDADYWRAATYIWGLAKGGSFADGMQNYLLSIGITQDEINEFRNLMLE